MPDVTLLLLVLAIPIGLLIGIAAGVVGYTAWPMIVPLLFVIGGYSVYEAILTSVIIDLVNSTIMTLIYARRGDVDVKDGLKIGGASTIGVLAGVLVAFAILDNFTSLFRGGVGYVNIGLGVFFLVRGYNMAKKASAGLPGAPLPVDSAAGDLLAGEVAAPAGTPPGSSPVAPSKPPEKQGLLVRWQQNLTERQKFLVTVAFSIFNAFLVGLVGFGGAMNIVLFLVILLRIPPIRAVGTAMVFAVVVLAVMLVAYLVFLDFQVVTWPYVLSYSLFSLAGLLVGSHFAKKIPDHALNYLIGVIVILTGVAATIQTLVIA